MILGCAQRAWHDDVQRRLGTRVEVLLRESGGGTVLVGPWLVGTSVVVPHDHPWVRTGVVASYRHLADLHVDALTALGVDGRAMRPEEVAAANNAAPVVRWACFGSLSPWEVVDAGGRKIVGLAQRRRRDAVLLVAGTLVDEPDWALLCDAVGRPQDVASLHERTASCARLADAPVTAAQLAAAIERRLTQALQPSAG
ncbi:MAG: ligase [Ideonella sp.]|nr:ligase [Ideonella sp.]MCC7457943.1 hypothetical protein [Nitrospira sp.]